MVAAAVAATIVWQLRQDGETTGGPLADTTVGDQLLTVITSCSPVTTTDLQTIYIGFAMFGQENFPLPDATIERIDYEVSSDVIRHRPVYAAGDGIPAGPSMNVAAGNWETDGRFIYEDLPAKLGPNSGLGVLIEVALEGETNPIEPALSITGIGYVDSEGDSYALPLERKHWVTRRDSGDEEYCTAHDS